jgi:hypothetical protein
MWAKIEKWRVHIAGIVLFLSMMDSMIYFNIGGFKLKSYQLLSMVLLLPIRYIHKKALLFFLIFNGLLFLSCYRGYILGATTLAIWVNIIKLEIFALFLLNFSSITILYENRRLLFEYIFWGAFLSSTYGLIQFLCFNLFGYVVPGNPESAILGEHLLKRVYSFFPEPNWYSLQIMLAVPTSYLLIKGDRLRMIGFCVILLGLLLSMSRGAWICLVLFFYFLYLEQKGPIKAISTVLAPLAVFVFLIAVGIFFSNNEFFYRLTHLDFANDPSFSSRLDAILAMGNYYSYIVDGKDWISLSIGCGMLSFQNLFWPWEPTHETSFFAMNMYLDLLIEHGLLIVLAILFISIKYIRKILGYKGYSSKSMRMFALVFISVMFMSAFYPLKSYLSNLPILAFFIALLIQFPFSIKETGSEFA